MKYDIEYRFWGTSKLYYIRANTAKHRNLVLKELLNDYSVTSIYIYKVYKDNNRVLIDTKIIHVCE